VARAVVVDVECSCEGGGVLVVIFCLDGSGGCRRDSSPIDYVSVLIRCYIWQ
jgi:hypothetical protein